MNIYTDSRFTPSWIGFAHSFAGQDESDQAMAAYRTAARRFPGSHVPMLSIGMEYGKTANHNVAEQSLLRASRIMSGDPAVQNELAVIMYRAEDYLAANGYILECLRMLPEPMTLSWVTVVINAGHIQRKLNRYAEAIQYYESALTLCPNDYVVLSALGFTYHLMGGHYLLEALGYYNKVLSIAPEDPFTNEIIKVAFSEDATFRRMGN